ncbi:WhiB family transcriptional regulator [Streptomyces wuyuanensis]|uniref:WhiB family transcriptional regulator n=1 Tax=Streptomyces wuyuanensis TaxID=1196353 RepID=UPI003419EDA1
MRAACLASPTDVFFSQYGSVTETEALRTCAACPVRTECLAFALDERIPDGIFGGSTAVWRRQMLARHPQVISWHKLLADALAHHHRRIRQEATDVASSTTTGRVPPDALDGTTHSRPRYRRMGRRISSSSSSRPASSTSSTTLHHSYPDQQFSPTDS